MYMAGRSRTASSPSSTLILLESYTSPLPAPWPFRFVAIEPLCGAGGLACQMHVLSDPHGHYNVAVKLARAVFADFRPNLGRAVRILEREPDLLFGNRAQELKQVLRVETDIQRRAGILGRDTLFALARFRNGREDLDLAGTKLHVNRTGTLVGELRHAFDGRADLVPPEDDENLDRK